MTRRPAFASWWWRRRQVLLRCMLLLLATAHGAFSAQATAATTAKPSAPPATTPPTPVATAGRAATTNAAAASDAFHGLALLACDPTERTAVLRASPTATLQVLHEGDVLRDNGVVLVAVAPDRALVRAKEGPDQRLAWIDRAGDDGVSRVLVIDPRAPPRADREPMTIRLAAPKNGSRHIALPQPTPHS